MKPRRLVFGGRVLAAGLWFDRQLLGDGESRRRVLARLETGSRVVDVAGGYLLWFERSRHLDADFAEGTPIVSFGAFWICAPLREVELSDVEAPPGSILLVRGGDISVHGAQRIDPVDVSTWLDLEGWTVASVASLGREPVVRAPELVGGDEPTSVLEILGDAVPEPDPQREKIIEALAALANDQGSGPLAGQFGSSGEGTSGGVMSAFGEWLGRMFGPSNAPALPSGRGAGESGTSAPREPPRPGWFRRWLTRLVTGSPLSIMIGRKQAEYLEKTFQMFEDGKWHEALRHAIPFGSLPGAPQPPSLGVPTPRAELNLDASQGAPANTSLTLGDEYYERLKDLYRRAARELEAAGRIEEAAFVLFQLLGDNDEGIAMLERHEEYALAARMAQGRDMPAGLVIRLWFLAGDPARAILVARRTGAFADAIARLERSHPDLAVRLRILWADRLAEAGDYAAAVDAVWPAEVARRLAFAWVERAIDFGGPVACRMLAKKLELRRDDPAARVQVRDAVLARLADTSEEAAQIRAALGRAWLDMSKPVPPLARELGRTIARRLMLDAPDTGNADVARELATATEDEVFRLDTAGMSPSFRVGPAAPRSHIFDAHERGLTPIVDAVPLPNGRFLVALGDAGLRLVDGRGKTLRAYERPAHHLVVADSGTRAIVVAERGKTRSLARIDLVTGAARTWCDARFEHFTSGYDGASWFLTTEDAIVSVDAQSPGFDALWRVGQLPHPAVALARAPDRLAFVLHDREASVLEVWTYELTGSGPVLRGRRSVEVPSSGPLHSVSVHPQGWVVARVGAIEPAQPKLVALGPQAIRMEVLCPEVRHFIARSNRIDILMPSVPGVFDLRRLNYGDLSFGDTKLVLRGATQVHARGITDDDRESTIVTDDRGRLVEVGSDGAIRRWLFL